MNRKDLISVIVPVYNVKPYLSECVDSILKQTYENFELILIDDGSTDGSGDICEEYSKKDDRISVIHKKHGGPSSTRNVGVEFSKGDYIAFVDADDIITENYLEILYENIISYGADVSICKFLRFRNDEKPAVNSDNIPQTRDKKYLFARLSGIGGDSTPYVVAWGKIIRRNIAEKLLFPVGKWHEDEFYVNQLIKTAEVFVETPAELYFYRQRDDSIVGMQNRNDPRHLAVIEAFKERVEICRKECDKSLYRRVVYSYRWMIINRYYIFRNTKYARKLKRLFFESFLRYPIKLDRAIKGYIVFLVSSEWYSKKYLKRK